MLQDAILTAAMVLVDERVLEVIHPRRGQAFEHTVLFNLQVDFEGKAPVLELMLLAPDNLGDQRVV